MPQIDISICSVGTVLFSSQTGWMGKIQCCKKTNPMTASNYRGALIGALLVSHIITVASEHSCSSRAVQLYCDNLGVIHHALHPEFPIKAKQPQADVLTIFTHNLQPQIPWSYYHVYGHPDDTIKFQYLSLPEQLNVMADKLAKEAILEVAATGQYCKPYFPNENIQVLVNGDKATTSIKAHLSQVWGRQVAKDLFHCKHIIHKQHFDYSHWD